MCLRPSSAARCFSCVGLDLSTLKPCGQTYDGFHIHTAYVAWLPPIAWAWISLHWGLVIRRGLSHTHSGMRDLVSTHDLSKPCLNVFQTYRVGLDLYIGVLWSGVGFHIHTVTCVTWFPLTISNPCLNVLQLNYKLEWTWKTTSQTCIHISKSCIHYFKGGVRGGQPRHQSCITFNLFIISKAEREAASLAIEHLKSKSKFKHHLVVDNDNDTRIRRIMLLYRISNIRIVSYARSGQLRNIGATYPPVHTRQSYTLG